MAVVPILIVEDEALLLMLLCEAFEDAGFNVVAASSAEQAILLITTRQVTAVPVLVTDLNLGPGLDGVALAAEVRRLCPGVAVMYATGNASWLSGQADAFRPGDRLFAKPYDLSGLVAAVQAAAATDRDGWPNSDRAISEVSA